jgi:hypothetical protein
MERRMQPDQLRARILLWDEEQIRLGNLSQKSTAILEAVLYGGELPHGDTANIVGAGDRQARRVVSASLRRKARARICALLSAQPSPRAGCRAVSGQFELSWRDQWPKKKKTKEVKAKAVRAKIADRTKMMMDAFFQRCLPSQKQPAE